MQIIGYVDSNFATNVDNRKSVTGYITTFGGMILNWSSKNQPMVTLSSTEAEYVALATSAQDILFDQQLLDELTTKQEKPSLLYEDNTGAIFLAKNSQVSGRTKHIDTRHHFIRQLIQEKRLEVTFVRSAENYADLLTKNLPEKQFATHVAALQQGSLDGWRKDVATG